MDVVAVCIKRTEFVVDGRICRLACLRLSREVVGQLGIGIRTGFLLGVELLARDGIRRGVGEHAVLEVRDGLTARIDTIYRDGRAASRRCTTLFTRLDGQALAIDNGRIGRGLLLVAFACRFRRRVRAAVEVLEVLGQLQIHRSIASLVISSTRNNGDIAGRPISFFIFFIFILFTKRRAAEFQLMIEFDIGSFARITSILHAVIERGNGMFIGRIILIVVDNAGNAVLAILAVDTGSTGFRLDDSRGLTILAFRTNKADGPVFAVLTIFAIMTDDNII